MARAYTVYRTRSFDEDLYWSNAEGWVDLQDATLFSISESNHNEPPIGTVAIDNIELQGIKRVVESTRKEFPPGEIQKRALLDQMVALSIKAYDDQRATCVKILESVDIQCYDHENLTDLLTAIASNINDGTLECNCITNAEPHNSRYYRDPVDA